MMNPKIIIKYVSDKASESETEELYRWINASQENKEEFLMYKKTWSLTEKSSDNPNDAWNIIFNRLFNKNTIVLRYYRLMKYAALIILFVGSGMLLQYGLARVNKMNLIYQAESKIEVPLGQLTNLKFPDGTTVVLNSGSQLTYSGGYSLGKRKVFLEGEAFFNVAKDKKHMFTVSTKALDFNVYGTSFNIKAYPKEDNIISTLVEGSLGVIDKDGHELTLLKPGQNANYNTKSLEFSTEDVNYDLYTSWKDGLITFRNEKLKDIAVKLQRWYNVEIVINNQEVGEQKYYGTIMKNKPIDEILEVLHLTSSMKYKIFSRADKPTLIYME